MSTEALTVAGLLQKGEEEFDALIKAMPIKSLMEVISGLQKEMAKEQATFDSLSGELHTRKEKNSRQSKQISKDMVTSQQRLTLLMNRSMKCFAQQNVSASKGTQLKRRNSAKGSQPVIAPAEKSTNIHRSRSMHSVNQSDDLVPVSNLKPSFLSRKPPIASSTTPGSAGHKPVIMKPLMNGGVAAAKKSVTSERMTNGNSSGSSKDGNVSAATPSSSSATTTTSEAGVGIYIKRKQNPKVFSTTSITHPSIPQPMTIAYPIASTASLPPKPPSSVVPTTSISTASSLSSSHSSSSVSSTASPSPRVQILQTKQRPTTSTFLTPSNPLLLAKSRPGLSRSQIIGQNDNEESQKTQDELRGLPSVKLLAQTFGSNTALHTASTNSSTSSLTVGRLTPGRAVSRSSSSVCFGQSKNPHISFNRISITKSKGEENPPATNAASAVNGDRGKTQPQLQHLKENVPTNQVQVEQRNGIPQRTSSPSPNISEKPVTNGASSELEMARARLKSNRNSTEVLDSSSSLPTTDNERSGHSTNNNNKAPSSENQRDSRTEDKPQENVRPVSYVKKSGALGVKGQSKVTTTSAAAAAGTNNPTSSLTPASKTNTASTNGASSNLINSATSSIAPPTSNNNNMRRSKSREDIHSKTGLQLMPDRAGLLKQIEARRVEPDADQSNGSNFQSMANLSRSMPSLLAAESIFNPPTYGTGTRDDPIKSSIALEQTTPAAAGLPAGQVVDDVEDGQPRMNLKDWDPSTAISELYQVKLMEEEVEDISHQYISMEGLMEKLPMNKKKATLLKTWKRRFFKAQDGWLYYYESGNRDRPSETIQLMGGAIHDLGNRILGIDDGRGRYLMVRCPTEKEYGQWKVALESQTADNTKATYVVPMLKSPKNASKNVVVIDLGSSAIRAGILGEKASLPEIFFPSLVAVDKKTGKVVAVGQDATQPLMRQRCDIVPPIRPSNKVDQFNIEVQLLTPVFSKVFKDLGVNPQDYMVMLCTPQNLGDSLKKGLMKVLVDELRVKAICMVQQSLLALYSYNATSGVIVDIGHRIEILPIYDGFVIEGGVARCPYGGQKVQEALTTALLANNYKLVSPTEQWLVRYIMEKSCYVATVYAQEEECCRDKPQIIKTNVNFNKLHLPEGAYQSVGHDLSRFKSPEGFFNVDLWEMDYPTLQKLVHQAIQTCPMDNRRHMWRAIFLSGGVTMLPGFAERLEGELIKLAPPGVPVEVHASPQRYHAAYIGACFVALLPQFADMAVSREEWKSGGVKTFKKWQT